MRKRLRLGGRDLGLLQYLFEVKVATRLQISRDVFFQTHKTNTVRRLKELERDGYLRISASSNESGRFIGIYSLTSKASALVSDKRKFGADLREQLKSNSVTHDLKLGDIRSKFLSFQMVEDYISENKYLCFQLSLSEVIQESSEQLLPDAIVRLRFESGVKYFPLEYESTIKSVDRCREKLARYHLKSEFPAVLFVCSNKSILKRFTKIEQELTENYRYKTFFILLSEFEKNSSEYIFSNPVGKIIRIR